MPVIAAVIAAAHPLPPARTEIRCPFAPIFFENGAQEISPHGRYLLANSFDWVLDRSRGDVRIVLTTASREPDTVDIVALSHARAEAVRAALVAEGVPADHIIVAHDYRDGLDLVEGRFAVGWVDLAFYVSPSVLDRIRRPGLTC